MEFLYNLCIFIQAIFSLQQNMRVSPVNFTNKKELRQTKQIIQNYNQLSMSPLTNFQEKIQLFEFLSLQTDNMQSSNTKLTVAANPWTNKVKIRGQGKLNSIMSKYLNDDQQWVTDTSMTSQQKLCLELAEQINKKYQPHNIIDANMTNLFQLKKKCQKIDQILEWLQKIENRNCSNQQKNVSEETTKNKSVPIDSSFVYLPISSGTVFHEILRDCTIKDKQKSIGEYRNPKLKQLMQSMKNIQNFSQLLKNNIL